MQSTSRRTTFPSTMRYGLIDYSRYSALIPITSVCPEKQVSYAREQNGREVQRHRFAIVGRRGEGPPAPAQPHQGSQGSSCPLHRARSSSHSFLAFPYFSILQFDDTPEKLPIIAVKIEPIDPSLPSFPSLKNDTEDDDFGIIVDSEYPFHFLTTLMAFC